MTMQAIEKATKVQCDAQDLKNALLTVKSVATKCCRLSVAYYGKALIKSTNGDNILVIASNGDGNFISVCIPAEYKGDISFVVKINDIISFLGKEKIVALEVSDKSLCLHSSIANMELKSGFDSKDFVLPDCHYTEKHKLPESFTERLRCVLGFAATDNCRTVLKRVSLITENNKLNLAAADGFRLGIADIKYDEQIDKVILPNLACQIVSRFARKSDVYIELDSTKTYVRFSFNNITVSEKIVIGTYPMYRQLVPAYSSEQWSFDCNSPMLCYRLGQIIDTGSNIIRIIGKENNLSISAELEEYYKYQTVIPIENNKNTGHIAISKNYLIQGLKPFVNAKCDVSSPSSAMMITGDVEGLTILIMPMFVQW